MKKITKTKFNNLSFSNFESCKSQQTYLRGEIFLKNRTIQSKFTYFE